MVGVIDTSLEHCFITKLVNFAGQYTQYDDCCYSILFCCRVHLSICQSTGDSGSDNNSSDAAINSPVPGSAIRTRKSAAAKELAEADAQQERYVSVWIYYEMLLIITSF